MITAILLLLALAILSMLAAWFTGPASLARVGTAAGVAALLSASAIAVINTDLDASDSGATLAASVMAAAMVLAIVGGGPLTTIVFQAVDSGATPPVIASGAVLRGGAWIGTLERAAICATLIAGWPEGVAIVLAIKGLGRYPELHSGNNAGTAERFIIGTGTSVLWAAACAGLVHAL